MRNTQDRYAPRQPLKPSLTRIRSAVTNGSTIFPDIDARSSWMRRLRDLIASHTSDLGGDDFISEAERRLIRRAAILTLQLELTEHGWASQHDGVAGAKSLQLYQQVTNTLRRTLEALGLQRRPRDITPSLDAYLASKQTPGSGGVGGGDQMQDAGYAHGHSVSPTNGPGRHADTINRSRHVEDVEDIEDDD
jgi:hypothetical protein